MSIDCDSFEVARTAAWCLAGLVRPDGRFLYKYDPILGQARIGYNIVRHSGCVWALNLASAELSPSPNVRRAARRAMDWVTGNMVVATGPSAAGIAEEGIVKLGANALAVVALVSFRNFSPYDKQLVVALCNHIWAQQRPDGDFIHERNALTGEEKPFRSDYYTGEALLATLLASERLADTEQFDRARAMLITLIGRGYGIKQQSHWMMYAAETCNRLRPDVRFVNYAERIVDDILGRREYRLYERSTPVACRTEALLSYLRMASDLSEVGSRASHAWNAIEQNLALQLRDRLHSGAFRGGADDGQVRIDYLQHNLIAFLWHGHMRRKTTGWESPVKPKPCGLISLL